MGVCPSSWCTGGAAGETATSDGATAEEAQLKLYEQLKAGGKVSRGWLGVVIQEVTADLADALIDAGYEIRIDAAVEDMRDSPSEIRVPLTTTNAGKPQAGKQYIQSLTFQLQ